MGSTVSLIAQACAALGYYAGLVGIMRLAGKRLAGQTTTFDLLVLICLSVVLQRVALFEGRANAAVFIATVFGAHIVTARLCRHFPSFKQLIRGAPSPLVVNGHVFHRVLEEEGLTYEDLLAGCRKVGEQDPGRVSLATLEETGDISVVVATPGENVAPRESQLTAAGADR